MNSDYNMEFILRIMNLKYSLDYDVDVFKDCVLKFYIFISSDDELAESMLISDALRIISKAQILGANLLEDYEKYEEEEDEDLDEDVDNEEFEEDEEYEYFSEEQFNDECGEENTIYLEPEDFDIITEGLCDEIWEEENEKNIFFILQFENEEVMDRFINMEFDCD